MDLILLFIRALLLTIICECLVLSLLIRKSYLKICVSILLINCVTNPTINYLYLIHDVPLFLLEFGVVVCEIYPLKLAFHLGIKDAILYSILLNACSYCAGYFIFTFL
ncbi:hypothetical protein [Methanospirillum hungatei]|uniref:hypothetical protein n=1 Tax=Methanospirillum hungatei TaxID=2203 RepID=UPI0026EEC9BF|nr:hypothetical protein [Methanospirillum hungatei]MCA1917654.1 hypothetical protein [Methanospirillum hungatei]